MDILRKFLTPERKAILLHFAKSLGLTVAAALVGFISSPSFGKILPGPYAVVLAMLLIPVLHTLQKRWQDKKAAKKAGAGDASPKA